MFFVETNCAFISAQDSAWYSFVFSHSLWANSDTLPGTSTIASLNSVGVIDFSSAFALLSSKDTNINANTKTILWNRKTS